jgi:hypothetical protein
MTAALCLAAFLADAHARPVDFTDLARFGLTHQVPECPAAAAGYRRAQDHLHRVEAAAATPYWYGREDQALPGVLDARWRLAVWNAAWWASDARYPVYAVPKLAEIKKLIGPAYYRLGVLPAPVAGERGRGE